MEASSPLKTIILIRSSRTDLKVFPAEVKDVMGYALYQAQLGLKAASAKPLRGFGGAGVLEVVANYQTDTYRAVYTVKFSNFIFVLHAFQKKSRKGITTPKPNIDLVKKRLRAAQEDHEARRAAKELSK
ncbi:MAG: type II toxin-antitoxin system RelE/ParE family toxin [Acidobacteria bacterium]|nr:type II toxin-antitoxin system RelE/ParE family toxin [Acidobacteriota bacterium]